MAKRLAFSGMLSTRRLNGICTSTLSPQFQPLEEPQPPPPDCAVVLREPTAPDHDVGRPEETK
jgi:hypothetical protein